MGPEPSIKIRLERHNKLVECLDSPSFRVFMCKRLQGDYVVKVKINGGWHTVGYYNSRLYAVAMVEAFWWFKYPELIPSPDKRCVKYLRDWIPRYAHK